MKRTSVISIIVLSLLLGTTALGYAQQEQQGDKRKQERGDKKDDKPGKSGRQGGQDRQDRRDTQASPDNPQRAHDAKPQQAPQTRAQQRLQQNYLARLGQQRLFLNDHYPDYARDPFFFTGAIYRRYNRGGRYYETNQYGASLLREAVNYGYAEGFRAGAADRLDRWHFSYQDSYAYQDANFGYNGYYVERDDYNFYFREGFRRGYEDGFNSRYQYGRYANGSYRMNDSALTVVLNFQSLR
jgi:hypothetical protein